MPEARLNRTRERRIASEIIADAYSAEEQAMSWYYYLEEKLLFPFTARCTARRSISPLKKGEQVNVLAMAREADCQADMFVLIDLDGRRLGVPLAQLQVVKAQRRTREAIKDWRYRVARGYAF
jgi:hypothetical protein